MDALPEYSMMVGEVRWRCLGFGGEGVPYRMAQNFPMLLEAARAARRRAYAPYSRFQVVAALLMDGVEFTGTNVENASYGGTLCAERSAVSAAVSSGRRSLELIAVSTDASELSEIGMRAPCGLCRQVISEFATPGLLVLLDGGTAIDGTAQGDVIPFDLLLPWRFRLKGERLG
jgi:cytidine deaminase